jgi:hypothetical protein
MSGRDDHWEVRTAADEAEVLRRVLRFQRDTIVLKIDGLDEESARRPMVDSGTSLCGIVKHLTHVERWWFQAVFAGRDVEFPWSEDDGDADWRVAPGEKVEDLVAGYRAACAESDRIVAGRSVDEVAQHERYDPNLRWIMLHMIEETARHAGHADILREQIDGVTGT